MRPPVRWCPLAFAGEAVSQTLRGLTEQPALHVDSLGGADLRGGWKGRGYDYGLSSRCDGPFGARLSSCHGWKSCGCPSAPTTGSQPFKIVNFREASAFSGISCLSANDCVAAGTSSRVNLSGSRTYIQVWNGSQWLAVPSANEDVQAPYTDNNLNAVSCTGPSFCMAVGTYSGGGYGAVDQTLAEMWNGTEWSILTTPDVGTNANNYLYSVSCTSSTFCEAVGAQEGTYGLLIEVWNGSSWSPQLTTGTGCGGAYCPPEVLNSVSCLGPTGSDCIAVGDVPTSSGSSETLAMSWDGTSWSVLSSPDPDSGWNTLNGVSCVGASDCFAVGYASASSEPIYPLIEEWNGSAWSVSQSNSGTVAMQLDGISCDSSDGTMGCLAVGHGPDSNPYAELWDGSVWSAVGVPN